MRLSGKQRAYWREPEHRWMVKYGAARSGKTYLDLYCIPRRVRERKGKDGLTVLIGNTRGTLERNVLAPMRTMYGEMLVGHAAQDGRIALFGETAYALGADTKRAVDRLRGASVKYCYGDEVVTWEEEVFTMLKSRLDKPYSCFEGTCNPAGPEHWFKRFLDSDADIFAQGYALDDNPFLDRSVREALKKEHSGVFYERYILGRWAAAEGLVFPALAREPEKVLVRCSERGKYEKIAVGIDFGGFGSRTCMTAVGFSEHMTCLTVLAERALPVRESVDAADIAREYIAFYRDVAGRFGHLEHVFGDSASPTMINTLISAARDAHLPWRMIGRCVKNDVTQRPVTVDLLLGTGRLHIDERCTELLRALCSLRWDAKDPSRPEDKNIGNINDYYDSFCYAFLPWAPMLERGGARVRQER